MMNIREMLNTDIFYVYMTMSLFQLSVVIFITESKTINIDNSDPETRHL